MSYRSAKHLTGLFVLLFALVSCSDNPAIRYRYEAEKMLFNAEQTTAKLKGVSARLNRQQLQQVYPLFHDCIEYCYRALDSVPPDIHPVEHMELKYLAYESSLKLSRHFYSTKQYDSSVAILNRLNSTVQLNDNQMLPTYLNLGNALKAAGQWDSARTVYNATVEKFYPPVNRMGELVLPAFHLPRHIYQVTKALGDEPGADREFSRAEQYYRNVIAEFPETDYAVVAHLALADLYNETRQREKELTELSAAADSTSPTYRNTLLRMADAYGGGLRQFDTALAIYDYLFNTIGPDDTTALGPEVLFRKSLLKMEQREYDQTRAVLGRIKKDYPKYYDTVPMPQYTLARSLELEGKWERAQSEYGLLIEKYRGSNEAMMALLLVMDYLGEKGRTDESLVWYGKAEKYYDEMAVKGTGTLLEARALFYKAELKRRRAEYAAAAEILLAIFEKFSDTEPGQKALVAAAGLYRDNLRDAGKADSLMNIRKLYVPNLVDSGSK